MCLPFYFTYAHSSLIVHGSAMGMGARAGRRARMRTIRAAALVAISVSVSPLSASCLHVPLLSHVCQGHCPVAHKSFKIK